MCAQPDAALAPRFRLVAAELGPPASQARGDRPNQYRVSLGHFHTQDGGDLNRRERRQSSPGEKTRPAMCRLYPTCWQPTCACHDHAIWVAGVYVVRASSVGLRRARPNITGLYLRFGPAAGAHLPIAAPAHGADHYKLSLRIYGNQAWFA